GSVGEMLTQHDGVDGITFTGETATGSQIMKAAAPGLKPLSFELGGKNAGIVFAEADMDKAIEGTLRSAFANCGQVCLATEQLYVHRSRFDEFVERLNQGAEDLTMGWWQDDGVSFGPLISRVHQDKVLSYYETARAEGAEVITGGGVPDMPEALRAGNWVQPTIWTGLPETSQVIREEIFGPCCH